MVEVLLNTLSVLAVYAGLVVVYTLLGAYASIDIKKQQWDWNKYINGLAKWLVLGISVVGATVASFKLAQLSNQFGINISNLEAISTRAILALAVVGSGNMLAKIVKKLAFIFSVDEETLKAIQEKSVETPSDKPLFLEIKDLPKVSKKAVKAQQEFEIEGGRGAFYAISTDSWQAFRSQIINRGFDIDGAYGYQCLTAGHLVSMADGSLRAVEDLEIGDIVKGGNKVVGNEVKPSRITKVKTSMGTFHTTPEHRFILEDNRTVEARNLKKGDVIALNNTEPQKQFELSDDELRFLGFYLGDGTKKYRWQNSTKPEIFLTIGTIAKQFYIDSLKMSLKFRKHSNGEAGIMSLVNQDHSTLMELIHQIDGKSLPQVFTKEQYALIIEGYLMADGSFKGNSIVATSTNKSLLVSLQFGAILNGWRAILSDKQEREAANYSTTPKPIWRLTINKSFKPIAKVLSAVELEDEGSVYVLNLDGNHLYYADNHLHHNCWDGVALLWQQFGQALITGNGAARGCWELNRDRNANPHFELIFDKTQIKAGDALFFAGSRWGHTGFADEDYNGSNYIKCLGQNQRGNGSGHPFTVDNISLNNFLGAMRLKKWSKTPNKAPTSPAEVKDGSKPVPAPKNAVEGLKTGDTVVPISLVDYYGTELTQYDPNYTIIELIGDRAVLSARGQVWAAMKVDNLRKV